MEQEDHAILNESKEISEQDLFHVDESEGVMDDTPADPQVKVVPEAIHQELVDKLVTKWILGMRRMRMRRMRMRRSQGLISTWTPS